jgi:cytochrome c oxidase subunit 2
MLASLLDPAAVPPPNDATGGAWSTLYQASTFAAEVDNVYLFIVFLDVLSFVGVIGAMALFMKRYRRRSKDQKTGSITHNGRLEFLWSAIPTVLLLVIFFWSNAIWMRMATPPSDAIDIRVKGQKWFWTVEYPNNPGVTLNNEIIVPVGKPVRLTMTSDDVLHSFFIPAFRVKRDAIPGRYTTMWFEASRAGTYNLFCAEYCGDQHSGMIGVVRALPANEYVAALEEAGRLRQDDGESAAAFGQRIYMRKGCNACHSLNGTPMTGPTFQGIWGREETLADGSKVTVDDEYVRESLMEPNAKVVAGFTPQMPSFAGQLEPAHVAAIVEFLKTVK